MDRKSMVLKGSAIETTVASFLKQPKHKCMLQINQKKESPIFFAGSIKVTFSKWIKDRQSINPFMFESSGLTRLRKRKKGRKKEVDLPFFMDQHGICLDFGFFLPVKIFFQRTLWRIYSAKNILAHNFIKKKTSCQSTSRYSTNNFWPAVKVKQNILSDRFKKFMAH